MLSICIATYNRARFIGETLDSILCQAQEEMEIVIVDGASTDDTRDVVEGYMRRYPSIRYYRMEKKGGVDQDFSRAVELSQGEYCWLFSDDDILKPGAIARVCTELQRTYDLVIVNAEIRNADLSRILSGRALLHSSDRIYSPAEGETLFRDTANYLSFIGAVVIRRDLWTKREKRAYFGTAFIHLGVIFQSPLEAPSLVISNPYVIIRYGNAEWSSRSFDIWMFQFPNLIWSFPHYSDAAKRKVYPQKPWQRADRLLRYRASGHYTMKEYAEKIAPLMTSRMHRCMARGVAMIPGEIVNGLVSLYAYLTGKRIVMIDLTSSPYHYGKFFKGKVPRVARGS
jgi:glycosyltransferase involved in cell wall biosynthesis